MASLCQSIELCDPFSLNIEEYLFRILIDCNEFETGPMVGCFLINFL